MLPYNLILFIHTFFIASLLFSGVYLITIRGFHRPVCYIAIACLLNAFLNTMNVLQVQGTPQHGYVLWNPLHLLNSYLTVPLLYAYLFDLMRPGSLRIRYWTVTYAPLVVFVVLHLVFAAVRGPLPLFTKYAEIAAYRHEPELWMRFVAACLIAVMNFVLVVRSMRMLRQHISTLKSNFSYTEGSTLGWIWWWLTFTVIKVMFLLLVISVDSMAVTLTGILSFTIEPVISSTLILRQKNLYAKPAPANEKQLPNKIPATMDTGVAKMTSNKRRDLKKNLMNLLHKEEIFKDPELNIEKIREMLGTNRTYLSQVINQDMNTTFYQLINTCRLEKAASMMRNPLQKDIPLKSIAEICGFKSMSAFFTLFKQSYGKTPTEWRGELEE